MYRMACLYGLGIHKQPVLQYCSQGYCPLPEGVSQEREGAGSCNVFMMKSPSLQTNCFLYGLHESALFHVCGDCRFLCKGHNFRAGLSCLGYTAALIIRKSFSFLEVTVLGLYHRTSDVLMSWEWTIELHTKRWQGWLERGGSICPGLHACLLTCLRKFRLHYRTHFFTIWFTFYTHEENEYCPIHLMQG